MLEVVAISAGIGAPSSSRMLNNMLTTEFTRKTTESHVTTIELRDHAVDIINNMTSGYASPKLSIVLEQVYNADVLIVVSPVFTASMSGLFKSFFDIIDNQALVNKVVIMGATGGSARHSMVLDFAMRPMFAYLKADIIPTTIFAASDDWGQASDVEDRVKKAVGEALLRVSQKDGYNAVSQVVADDEFDDSNVNSGTMTSLPFEVMLANITKSKRIAVS